MTRFTFAILLLITAVAVVIFGLMPAWQEVSRLRMEIAGLIRLNDELQEIASIRDEITAQYNAIPESDLGRLSSILPSSFGTAQYLRDMETLASRHGVLLKNIDFVTQQQPSTRIRLPSQRLFTPIDVSFNVRAPYVSFRSFLGDLEKMLRITDVSDISFTAQVPASAGAAGGVSAFEYAVKGSIYYAR